MSFIKNIVSWFKQESIKTGAWFTSRRRVEEVPWPEMEDSRVSNKSPTILAKIHQRSKQSEEAIFVGLTVFLVGLLIFFYGIYLVNQLYQKNAIINKQKKQVVKLQRSNTAFNDELEDKERTILVQADELSMYKNALKLREFYKKEAERYRRELEEAKKNGK